jgi:hypothetical protein
MHKLRLRFHDNACVHPDRLTDSVGCDKGASTEWYNGPQAQQSFVIQMYSYD